MSRVLRALHVDLPGVFVDLAKKLAEIHALCTRCPQAMLANNECEFGDIMRCTLALKIIRRDAAIHHQPRAGCPARFVGGEIERHVHDVFCFAETA